MKTVICNGLLWTLNDGASPEALGMMPSFLDAFDQRHAREQLDANYGYGSYWESEPYKLTADGTMLYPGDPPMSWVAWTQLRDEMVLMYPYSFVAVVQPDGSFVIERMD